MKLARKNSIDAGDLKEQVTLLQPTRVADGRGGFTTTYTTFGNVWARVLPVRGVRQLTDAQLQYREAFDFVIRVQEIPITADWRIVYDGRTFTIHSIDDIQTRRQYYTMLCYT